MNLFKNKSKPSKVLRSVALLSCLLVSSVVPANNNTILEAIQFVDRPVFDQKRDSSRKPFETLKFFGAQKGMTVADIFSGSGYYSELLSHIVGENGKVIAHNNHAYNEYMKDYIAIRFRNNRLANVIRLTSEANEIEITENSVDLVFLILAYHDIYYTPRNGSWPTIDKTDFLNRVYTMLKPGGTLAIIDHYAKPGSPSESGNKLHRIDKRLVIKELEEANFKLVAESDHLFNPQDDLEKHMFAPEIRGNTSRFALKFIKPLAIDRQLVDQENLPQYD